MLLAVSIMHHHFEHEMAARPKTRQTHLQSSMAAAADACSRRSKDTPHATLWPLSQLWLIDSVSSRFSTV